MLTRDILYKRGLAMNIKSLGIAIGLLLGVVGGYWWYTHRTVELSPIVLNNGFHMNTCTSDAEKDFIRQQFKDNWIHLISSPDYDIEYFLNERGIYPFQPEYKGKMQIKVLYKDAVMVGFCAYYMKTPSEGSILFINVDKNHRGKRYGEELARYATQDLKRLGANFIRFSTKKTNMSAQKLYDRLGYQRTPSDEKHVGYRLSLL